jgi:hypothetical protein
LAKSLEVNRKSVEKKAQVNFGEGGGQKPHPVRLSNLSGGDFYPRADEFNDGEFLT